MEFTVSKLDLTQALYKAQGVVDRKTAQNILSHVLIESTSSTGIRVVATDYDVVLTGNYNAEVAVPGRMTVGAKHLFEVVKTLPDKPVHLTALDNHWVEVRCGSSRFKLAGLPPGDFPERTQPEGLKFFRISKRILSDLVDRTLFSVSHDETRPSLNGVFLRVVREESEVRLTMVSTDGHRLSKAEALGGDAGEFGPAAEAVIHTKALNELKRSLEGSEPDTQVAFHRGNVHFMNDEVTLQVRQLDETFPDYTKVIPQRSSVRVPIPKALFVAAIRRIATLTSAKTNIIRFELSPGRLVLSSSNPEMGEGRDELVVENESAEISVGFNFKYLLDVLGIISGENVFLSLSDQFSPGLITSPDDAGSLFVVMPMRV